MQFAEAFKTLGYNLENVRQDWSAQKPGGVCITLWKKEMMQRDGRPCFDLRKLHPNGGDWTKKPGHKKRTGHLKYAMQACDGRVDVVLVSGEPGQSYEDAEPWREEKRKAHWQILQFDEADGFFRAGIVAHSDKRASTA